LLVTYLQFQPLTETTKTLCAPAQMHYVQLSTYRLDSDSTAVLQLYY